MIYIGICDDQIKIVRVLEKVIADIQKEWSCEWEIDVFTSGRELLKSIQKMDAVFLDIEMPGMDGIQVGKEIRRQNPDCRIIMATGREDRVKEAFHIQAFRFVTKPFDKEEIQEALSAVLNRNIGTDAMELFYKRNACMVQQRDIHYIQAQDSYSEFVTGSQIFRKEVSLNDLEECLDDRMFCRIHKRYIINLHWVEEFKDGVMHIGGKRFIVSRRKKKEIEKKYVDYDLKYR